MTHADASRTEAPDSRAPTTGKAEDGAAHIYVLLYLPEGSAGALCETPGDADTLG